MREGKAWGVMFGHSRWMIRNAAMRLQKSQPFGLRPGTTAAALRLASIRF